MNREELPVKFRKGSLTGDVMRLASYTGKCGGSYAWGWWTAIEDLVKVNALGRGMKPSGETIGRRLREGRVKIQRRGWDILCECGRVCMLRPGDSGSKARKDLMALVAKEAGKKQ